MTDKRLYMRRWLLALLRYELQLRVKVARERNRFIKVQAEDYLAGARSNHLVADHESRLANILYEHYQAVMPYFGTLALKSAKSHRRYFEVKAKKLGGDFFSHMLEWAQTRALNNASTITATDMDEVRGAIDDGLTEGLGNAEIGRNIRRITGTTNFSASRIARTETHAAATFGAIEEARNAEQEIGIKLVKEWLPTIDNRTRPAHRDMAAKPPIPLDEKFEVDGEAMDRPGDPTASADNVINCRCAIITEEAAE